MNEKRTALFLRLFCVGLALCGLGFYAFALPDIGGSLAAMYPEYAYCLMPWLIFLWSTALPCYAVLAAVWKLSLNLGKHQIFTFGNARIINVISALAFGDTVFFLIGCLVFFFLGMSHPGIIIGSLFVGFFALCFSFCCRELSRYMKRAAELQEQSDYTI